MFNSERVNRRQPRATNRRSQKPLLQNSQERTNRNTTRAQKRQQKRHLHVTSNISDAARCIRACCRSAKLLGCDKRNASQTDHHLHLHPTHGAALLIVCLLLTCVWPLASLIGRHSPAPLCVAPAQTGLRSPCNGCTSTIVGSTLLINMSIGRRRARRLV